MVRHNNMISNGHFHKKWNYRVKMWFSQPMEKEKRHKRREKKQMHHLPMPVKRLRPIIHCPSSRYNSKVRAGRGFTQRELKQAGIHPKYATTIGIAVDHRRRDKCYETIAQNVCRLRVYKNNLVMLPSKDVIVAQVGKNLNKIKQPQAVLPPRVIKEEDKKFNPYEIVSQARSKAKRVGKKLRKKYLVDGLEDVTLK